MKDIRLDDIVVLKKGHACGANKWKIVRYGADIKLQCVNCDRIVMMPRVDVKKKVVKIIKEDLE